MKNLAQTFCEQHQACDRWFSDTEIAVNHGDWIDASAHFSNFQTHLYRHLKLEEDQLFPAIENITANLDGPTRMMRIEHQQIRHIIAALAEALEKQDSEMFFAQADMFRVMNFQHNLKEENILYPMADKLLSAYPNLIEHILMNDASSGQCGCQANHCIDSNISTETL